MFLPLNDFKILINSEAKMKITLTLLLLVLCIIGHAQNSPGFKIYNNPTFGKLFLEDTKDDGYVTLNFKNVEKLDIEIKAKEDEYKAKLSKIDFGNVPLTDEMIKKEQLSLDNLKNEISELRNKRKFYRNEYVKENLEYKRFTLGFWNERSQAFFEILYDTKGERFNLINNTGFNLGNNTGSIYSELVSGQLYIFRVSLGAMIASSSGEDQETASIDEAYQRLVTYGGNTVLKLEYPLIYSHAKNNQWTFISRIIAKGTSDFPEFGTTSEDWSGSWSYGLDIYGDVATSNNKLRFFMNFNANKIFGTDSYIKNLGLANSDFSFGQLKLGLVFNSNISLSFVVNTFSSESSLENKNVIVGGQILDAINNE